MAPQGPQRLRLGFAGTPEFAASILGRLIEPHDIAVVYSQPARPSGRGRKVIASPVEALARAHGFDVRTPRSLRGEVPHLQACGLDALIVAAYGLILPKSVLDVPRQGCLNVHASLLPRWRGAAPIERAIMAGDSRTGVSIMQMDEGLDTGAVLHQVECSIEPDDTGDSLREKLADLGGLALLDCLVQLGERVATAQPRDGVTYASKLLPGESLVNWHRTANQVELTIRALNSRQPAFCIVDGERIRLLAAMALDACGSDPQAGPPGEVISIDGTGFVVACAVGCIRISRVALTRGKGKPMDVASLLNGYPDLIRPGRSLESSP